MVETNEVAEQSTLLSGTTITGASGRRYRGLDVINELTGKWERALVGIIEPVLPSIATMAAGRAAQDNVQIGVGVMTLATAFVEHGIHRQFIAAAFPPDDDRRFPDNWETALEERMLDLDDLTPAQLLPLLMDFFGGASSSFQRIFGASLGSMTTNGNGAPQPTTAAVKPPAKRSRRE